MTKTQTLTLRILLMFILLAAAGLLFMASAMDAHASDAPTVTDTAGQVLAEIPLSAVATPAPVAAAAPAESAPVPAQPAARIDAHPLVVAAPAPAPAPALDGPQPYAPPVMHRDPQSGYCFGAGAQDLPADDAADPTCTQPPAPTTTTVPEATPEQIAAPLASLYPTVDGYPAPQPHEGSSAAPGQHYPTCWTGCSPTAAG